MEASRILQTYLDTVGTAVMAGDWETYADHMDLPFQVITESGNIDLSTAEKLWQAFEGFRQALQTQQITGYIRLVDTAAKLSVGLISGSYLTHLLSRGHRVLDPFFSEITLRLEGNGWRAASITNSLANSRWLLNIPRLAGSSPVKGSDHD